MNIKEVKKADEESDDSAEFNADELFDELSSTMDD